MFSLLQEKMESIIGPLAEKLSKNKTLNALQAGMMLSMPVSLGVSMIAVLTNFPVKPWLEFLSNIGLSSVLNEVLAASLNMLAIYIVVTIAYKYAQAENENGIVVATLTLAVFLVLMPQTIAVGEESISALKSSNLGSDGIFVAMIISIVVPKLYVFLSKKNIKLKLPESVPTMVSDSLSPVFVSMILFILVTAIKYLFTFTSYNNIFTFVSTVVAQPIMSFGSSPWALIGVYTFANFMWFFGIHPSAVTSVYRPVTSAAMLACIGAFAAGEPLPYATFFVIFWSIFNSGTGNTLGLALLASFAKSKHLRSVGRLSLIPNIFNINEPIVFGFPIIMNPIFFFPFVFSSLIPGVISMGIIKVIGTVTFNPTISLPWATPTIIASFIKGGLALGIIVVIATLVNTLLYYPFFKIADKRAYQEELNNQ
ncbi:PTS sugar transporter subunit IIC [Erysipelothrix sp. HDW6A]|uniref:PTS sugar transporter subunit IIC n=1 Tax=Erysipelothrix sp. HDW6A TaxID=2714928 RepID=UPI00140A8926|nr:PTS transporter subunit EIIC [Erysipelothrix sp. HDW6A]QIK57604.1 PTS sugar transporter subunit IIC [Erysipelothrix sp. HDW6A]